MISVHSFHKNSNTGNLIEYSVFIQHNLLKTFFFSFFFPEPRHVVKVPSDFIPNSVDVSPNISDCDVSVSEVAASCHEREGSDTLEKPFKLISLYVHQHEGNQSRNPYSIDPPQLVSWPHSAFLQCVRPSPVV